MLGVLFYIGVEGVLLGVLFHVSVEVWNSRCGGVLFHVVVYCSM